MKECYIEQHHSPAAPSSYAIASSAERILKTNFGILENWLRESLEQEPASGDDSPRSYPEGIISFSPGLVAAATYPGSRCRTLFFYAESVASWPAEGCNSFRVVVAGLVHAPRVAAAPQPWAEGLNSFGICANGQVCTPFEFPHSRLDKRTLFFVIANFFGNLSRLTVQTARGSRIVL
jgi:hypothetical protein